MDKKTLFDEMSKNYWLRHPKSYELFERASRYQIKGGSHNLRLLDPFPFYDIRCFGSKVTDVDGHTYVDFWQGHFANILGHNPPVILEALADFFKNGQGLTTGFPGIFQNELAELLIQQIRADRIRFTTSGSLATMYSVMLAKAFTKRELVLKAGGGWHGAQPYVLKGITVYDRGMNHLESAGLPPNVDSMILVTRFNDIENLEEIFREHGERIACFIVEPFIGAGGFIFSQNNYLQKARDLTRKYGSLLIFDEVVSGFRFHPGPVSTLYGIEPDLSVFGKAIGGGMPVSAVAGRRDVMELCNPETKAEDRVKFEGGTFSAHPSSMLAGLISIRYLMGHEKEIYPRIGKLGARVREGIEKIFRAYGFNARCTGYGNSIAENSSIVGVQFLREEIERITSPEQIWNPEICDVEMREKIFRLAMLEEGFNVFHGYGQITAAHADSEIQASLDAVERIAKKWSQQ